MTALVFGIAAAVTYGAADFIGGLATKRAGAVRVVLLSQLFGGVFVLGLILRFRGSAPALPAFIWGAVAGIAGSIGVALLYRGLARGRMSVVAPITGVEAAGVPVVFGIALGERPSVTALIGVGLALLAVVLVSSSPELPLEPNGTRGRAGIGEAIVAGIAFGAFFIALDQAGADTGMWPLAGARVSSIAVMVTVAAFGRISITPPPGSLPSIAAAGILDVAANLFFLLATRSGLLSLVAVLTSMYPAVTVGLARVVLKERLVAVQLVGMAVALVAVILIGIG